MTNVSIRLEHLSKSYRIGQRQKRQDTFVGSLLQGLQSPFHNLRRLRQLSTFGDKTGNSDDILWALKDISFTINQGDVVGIIGRNGAGKSTLLKILSRITYPSSGRVELFGRVSSLLEVGTGFHPELTGRENIYLNGTILGMTRAEIDRKFDEILAFSGVEKFIETPVKRYSSGMAVRLAFSVAAHLDPEILLVDEVLAVGDAEFQKKSLGQLDKVSKSGRTILFVSHQMNQIRRLCKQCIWIDNGQVMMKGDTPSVISAYEASTINLRGDQALEISERGRFVRWQIVEGYGSDAYTLDHFGSVTFQFTLQAKEATPFGHNGVLLFDSDNRIVWSASMSNLSIHPGDNQFTYQFPSLPLKPGVYTWFVTYYIGDEEITTWYALPYFTISTQSNMHRRDDLQGVLNIPWDFSSE